MLNIGDVIEIHGDKCTVIHHTIKNDIKYICVEFMSETPKFNIYTYIYDNDKLLVAEITDVEELKPLIEEFMKEEIDENNLEDEFLEKVQTLAQEFLANQGN